MADSYKYERTWSDRGIKKSEERVVLDMSLYEAANLRTLFQYHSLDVGQVPLKYFDTGDWYGQISHALDDVTIEKSPNASVNEIRESFERTQ